MHCATCEIKSLMYHYANLIDGGNFSEVGNLFSNGKVILGTDEPQEFSGAESVEAMYRAMAKLYEEDGTPKTMHVTTNIIVDVNNDGTTASAQSYVAVFQATEGFPLQPILLARYKDQFSKSDGSWNFVERRIEPGLSGDLSRHLPQIV